MTFKTRRRVFICSVIAALTLPAESILLKALETPTVEGAARQWVGTLSPDALDSASRSIRAFPFAYRRQIMTALGPWQRSRVWRAHIAEFVESHPELDSNTLALIQAASDLASPANLANPTDESRAQINTVANQIKALLGKDTAEYLLYRLGPSDGTFTASALPVSQRLANTVRGMFVALARATDCDCNFEWGCSAVAQCVDGTGCYLRTQWPACGWFWEDQCNGYCKVGGIGGS